MGMSQDHRPPGQHVIDVDILIHIVEARSFRTRDEARLSSHRAERANGAIDAAGDQLLGFGKEFGGPGCLHNGGAPYHGGRESVKKLVVVSAGTGSSRTQKCR